MQAFYKLSWIPSLMVIVGLMFVVSCNDDDEPPKAFISFETEESELFESEGVIDVTIKLDKAASENIVLSYSLGGTATEFSATTGGDYEIEPAGTITILKGESEFDIEIAVVEEDEEFEADLSGEEIISNETIILTITGVVSGPGQLGEVGLVHTVNIFEDDMFVYLDWDGSGTEESDVDMDLFIWADDPNDEIDGFTLIDAAAFKDNEPEALAIWGAYPDWEFGFSYNYYSGTNAELSFAAILVNLGGTVNGSSDVVVTEGSYTLDNLNNYDETDVAPPIIQTVSKSGLNYVNLTEIDEPASGSRKRTLVGSLNKANQTLLGKSIGVRKIQLPKGFAERIKK